MDVRILRRQDRGGGRAAASRNRQATLVSGSKE
jgi:hypothetical protein